MRSAAWTDLVVRDNDCPMTDSVRVAEAFGRHHRHVMRAIRVLVKKLTRMLPAEEVPKFGFFLQNNYLRDIRVRHYYRMTKNAFVLLAMGFEGEKALEVKLAYIRAFDRMAEIIRSYESGRLVRFQQAVGQYEAGKREASGHGRALNAWRYEKPNHLALLAELHPQLALEL